jgi:thymidylate synthase
MEVYLQLLRDVLENGKDRKDRTGVGTRSVFGRQLRVSLANEAFPLLTTKKLHVKSIIYELLWFLRGDSNVRYLQQHGVRIWNPWADEMGDLGPIYGVQWRSWKTADGRTVDQVKQVIDLIKKDPTSRRLLVSAWNVGELEQMALPPCHVLFQFYVNDQGLSCQVYQRSADIFLGLPFNIASYALLTRMIAHVCHLPTQELIFCLGDVHIYHNHFEQVKLQLGRTPFPLPKLIFKRQVESIDDFDYDDICIENYQAHPHIEAEVAI